MAETRDYTLGKGKVLFKKDGDDHFADLGNAPAFNLNVTVDKLEHFSSRAGLSKKDLEVITKLTMGGSFTLDEPNAQNCAMFVMSTGSTSASQSAESSGADLSGEGDSAGEITAHSLGSWQPLYKSVVSVESAAIEANPANDTGAGAGISIKGTISGIPATVVYEVQIDSTGAPDTFMWREDGGAWNYTENLTIEASAFAMGSYGLEVYGTGDDVAGNIVGDAWTITLSATNSSTDRVYDLDTANVPTVTGTSAKSGETYIEGIEGTGHYQVDYTAGLIYFNFDQSPGSADEIEVADVVAIADAQWLANADIVTTLGGTLTTLKGDIYFVGDPPQGRIVDIRGNCSLTPNGDWGLIGEDWMQYTFDIEFLEVPGNAQVIDVTDRGKVG